MKIYTLGPDKSFSSLGAKKFCKESGLNPANFSLEDSFAEIWTKLCKNPTDLAIIPIENTSSSSVHENIDAIFDNSKIQIFAEFFLQIDLHLIGQKNAKQEEIETIYSHPKALAQCKIFLSNFAGNTITAESTSQAAKIIREKNDAKIAFIGGKYLADENFKILAKNVANQKYNFTRFVLVGQKKSAFDVGTGRDLSTQITRNKATLIFETKHEAGALAKILTTISLLNGNLLKIESRPIPEKPHNYSFWVDIDQTGTPDNLFDILAKNLHSLRIVGVYKKGETIII